MVAAVEVAVDEVHLPHRQLIKRLAYRQQRLYMFAAAQPALSPHVCFPLLDLPVRGRVKLVACLSSIRKEDATP